LVLNGARFEDAFPPQEDIVNRPASGRCGLQTPDSSIRMASELPFDVSYSQSGGGVSSPLAQTAFDNRQVSPRTLAAGPTNTASRISAGCTWDGCELSFPSPEDLANHLTEHSQAVLARWVQHSGCIWQGCRSKAIFKSAGAYEHHLRNIHSYPLVCNAPRCPHKKPFRNHADLDRHNRTAHLKEQKYECPYDSCEAETRTFARKDKWLKHIRETQHQNDAICPLFHCSLKQRKTPKEFATRKEIIEHFNSYHSADPENRYECALGSCGDNLKPDFWTIGGLRDHIQDDHQFSSYSSMIKHVLKEERVFGIQQLRHYAAIFYESLAKCHDCTGCAAQSKSASCPDDKAIL
jgi:hypothetical protein